MFRHIYGCKRLFHNYKISSYLYSINPRQNEQVLLAEPGKFM